MVKGGGGDVYRDDAIEMARGRGGTGGRDGKRCGVTRLLAYGTGRQIFARRFEPVYMTARLKPEEKEGEGKDGMGVKLICR